MKEEQWEREEMALDMIQLRYSASHEHHMRVM